MNVEVTLKPTRIEAVAGTQVEIATKGIQGGSGDKGDKGDKGDTGNAGVWLQVTQAQYDALSPVEGTLYVIVG